MGRTTMVDHVRIIGILNLVWAAVTFLVGLQFFVVVTAAPMWVQIVAGALMVLAVLATVAGVGLLKRKRWGMTFAVVTAAVSLLSIPIGTVFGAYTLVMLRKPEIAGTLD